MAKTELYKIVESRKADLRTITIASVTTFAFLVTFAFSFGTLPSSIYYILATTLFLGIIISLIGIGLGTDFFDRKEPYRTFRIFHALSFAIFSGNITLIFITVVGIALIFNILASVMMGIFVFIYASRYKLKINLKKRNFSINP